MLSRKWICRVVTGAAILLYVVALAIAVVGTQGWFGVQPDGLAAVWLIFLGMPWTLMMTPIALFDGPAIIGKILAFLFALFPIVNIVILFRLCRNPKF